jgi:hypothetical protein
VVNVSEARDRHRLARGLARATVEATDAKTQRERELLPMSAGDMAQQVQIKVNGKVGKEPVTTNADVTFPLPFLNKLAPNQHNNTPDPTFASGVEIVTGGLVILQAQLQAWTEDESSFIVGAKMKLVAFSPNAYRLRRYSAVVHLTFFGYAAPAEDDTEG